MELRLYSFENKLSSLSIEDGLSSRRFVDLKMGLKNSDDKKPSDVIFYLIANGDEFDNADFVRSDAFDNIRIVRGDEFDCAYTFESMSNTPK